MESVEPISKPFFWRNTDERLEYREKCELERKGIASRFNRCNTKIRNAMKMKKSKPYINSYSYLLTKLLEDLMITKKKYRDSCFYMPHQIKNIWVFDICIKTSTPKPELAILTSMKKPTPKSETMQSFRKIHANANKRRKQIQSSNCPFSFSN